MGNYPYSSTYIMHGDSALPPLAAGRRLRASQQKHGSFSLHLWICTLTLLVVTPGCWLLHAPHAQSSDQELFEAFGEAVTVYYNSSNSHTYV